VSVASVSIASALSASATIPTSRAVPGIAGLHMQQLRSVGPRGCGGGKCCISLLSLLPLPSLLLSFSPGLAGPAAHKTLLFYGVVGTEVDFDLVRLSPILSWTRGSWSTSDCCHGPSLAPEHASRSLRSRSTDRQKKRLVKRLADLGYAVVIKPLAA
jgi:hypothetical protein